MSFKRLRSPWSEILIAVFLSSHSKCKRIIMFRTCSTHILIPFLVVTLGRIITDTESRDMYQVAFAGFFALCSKSTQKEVQWRHIHNTGFNGLTLDMDTKQMAGMFLPNLFLTYSY